MVQKLSRSEMERRELFRLEQPILMPGPQVLESQEKLTLVLLGMQGPWALPRFQDVAEKRVQAMELLRCMRPGPGPGKLAGKGVKPWNA
jgi:hypothetical protein